MIYLDNCATTYPKPCEVLESLNYAIENFTSPSRGHYKSSFDSSKMVYNLRCELSSFFGITNPLNVAFTSNATESINLVIESLLNSNDHVITSVLEHNSVIRPLVSRNISYDVLELSDDYTLKYSMLENLVKSNTKAVIITHSSNILGTVIDVKRISEFCKKNNLIFILDVAQSAGFVDIDMVSDNIDIICFTGHKSLYGIVGVGGIVVNDTFSIPFKNTKVGGSGYNSLSLHQNTQMPEVFEAGTMNFIGLNALLHGLKFVTNKGLKNIRDHELNLCNYVYENIKLIDGIKIYGNFNLDRTAILSFTYKDYDSNDISDILFNKYSIATRAGFHCVSLLHNKIGTIDTGVVRLSFSIFNTMEDAVKVTNAILEICK